MRCTPLQPVAHLWLAGRKPLYLSILRAGPPAVRNDQFNPLRSSEPPQLAPCAAFLLHSLHTSVAPHSAPHDTCPLLCLLGPAAQATIAIILPFSFPSLPPPARHKKVKLRVLKFYKVDDSGKVQRLRKVCPQCGPGIFMATHFNRVYCGKCHLVSATAQCHLLLARLVGRAGPWADLAGAPRSPRLCCAITLSRSLRACAGATALPIPRQKLASIPPPPCRRTCTTRRARPPKRSLPRGCTLSAAHAAGAPGSAGTPASERRGVPCGGMQLAGPSVGCSAAVIPLPQD